MSAHCPHFGTCGGCLSQDLPYPEQVARKSAVLAELLGPCWTRPVVVTPSPVVWHYRNKVDPAFSPKRYDTPPPRDFVRETVLGFKRTGRWFWPLDIETCLIGPEGLDMLLSAVRRWYIAEGLRAYDSRLGDGFLRVLLVREARHTGERMIVLITRRGPFSPAPFLDAVCEAWPATSIYHGVFEGKADVAAADELHLLHGAPAILERLHVPDEAAARVLSFRISPMSFFQTNTLATELLYGAVRAWVRAVQPRAVYDLYGGAGGIAFSVADLVEQVWSIESVMSASDDGRHNARANGIENVGFITAPVEKYLKGVAEERSWAAGGAAILDPPRAGLHPKALRRLIEIGPRHVLYVSCNPKIFVRELPQWFTEYHLTGVQAFDLFPHTPHVELVAAFERKAG